MRGSPAGRSAARTAASRRRTAAAGASSRSSGGCLGALVFDTALLFLGPALVALIVRFDHQPCADRTVPFWSLAATTAIVLVVAAWRVLRTRGRDYPQWAGFLIGTVALFIPALVTLLRASAAGCRSL